MLASMYASSSSATESLADWPVACMNVAARILFGMSREGIAPRPLGRAHRIHRTPSVALMIVTPFVLVPCAVLVGIVTAFVDFPITLIIWVIFAVVYQQVENYLIQPQIQKRATKVEAFIVLVAVLFGSALFVVLVAILAVPVAASIQIAVTEYRAYRQEVLAAEQEAGGPTPAPPPEGPTPAPEAT